MKQKKYFREKQKMFELEIESLAWGGKGLGRKNGKIFFVSKSVPKDKVLIKVTREKKDYGEGEIERIFYPSPDRISPICKDFNRCGGCQLQMMNYKSQIEGKEKIAREILRRWVNKAKFNAMVPMQNPYNYRHSGDFHIKRENENFFCGFYKQESHKIVNFENCHLFSKEFNLKIKKIKNFLEKWDKNKVYSFNLSCDENEKEFVATFYVREESKEVEKLKELLELAKLNGILVKDGRGRNILKEGECFLSYSIKPSDFVSKEIKFKIDPESFTQSNFEMNSKLVKESLRLSNLSKYETVLELYSGVGNFSLPLALKCKEIIAVEKSEIAVEDSKFNSNYNSILNIKNIKSDVKEQIIKLIYSSHFFDLVFLDPPRTGAFDVIENIISFNPKRIVYVSCNLPTLERDLRKFVYFGYEPQEFSFFDLFPQTYSIETIVLLSKLNEKN